MSPDLTAPPLAKQAVLKELEITDRLLKFWMNWYKLPVNRRGRGSTYPARTVETLKLIKRLADTRYFTMKFIRDLLRSDDGSNREAIESSLNLCRLRLGHAPHPRSSIDSRLVHAAAAARSSTGTPAAAVSAEKKIAEDLL